MKKTSALFFAVSMMMLASFTASAATLRGDVGNDGNVSIEDVTDLIDYLLTGDASGISLANADTDLDGNVTISDLTTMIDYLLTGTWGDDPVTPPAAGDWVDLGLPSGTIWATRNVGASAPEDYGDYFAWGETSPKEIYDWDTYKWSYNDANGYLKFTKYNMHSSYGTVDNKTELDPSDDAACAHYPGGRMPSVEQIQELCNNCTWTWTTQNGVNGRLVTGPNGNTLFLPVAGDRWSDYLDYAGSLGYYWSRTLYSDNPYYAFGLYFYSGNLDGWYNNYRYYGFAVRAVRVS